MAASAWTLFDRAKHKICTSTMPLSGGIFRLSFHRTSASANLVGDITVFTSVGSQCSGGGYAAKSVSTVRWTAGASAGQQKWDISTDPVVTAVGSTIDNIRYGVIRLSAGSTTSGHLLCYAALSTDQFSVSTGNTITVQIASTGVFTLT